MTRPPLLSLPGYLRCKELVRPHGILPCSAATLWAQVKAGRFPPPVKLFPGVTAWRVEDVQDFLAAAAAQSAPAASAPADGPVASARAGMGSKP